MFFDIGGTLGKVEPTSLTLHIFQDTISILSGARALGLKLGVITNVPRDVHKDRVRAMLADARISHLLDDDGLITSTDAGALKPRSEIFLFAANTLRLPVERCVYVGENPAEVAGAVAAGMHGILKS
jgi:FMN phosphatase YigB (HAD superfamily)